MEKIAAAEQNRLVTVVQHTNDKAVESFTQIMETEDTTRSFSHNLKTRVPMKKLVTERNRELKRESNSSEEKKIPLHDTISGVTSNPERPSKTKSEIVASPKWKSF